MTKIPFLPLAAGEFITKQDRQERQLRAIVREEIRAALNPSLLMTADERAKIAQRHAAWWRGEIKAGRIKATKDLEWLLRDLESVAR